MNTVHYLRDNPAFFRAGYTVMASATNLSTGYPMLDRLLPGGGWPTAAVTEILSRDGKIDPLSLLLPAFAALSWEPRWLVWVAPPQVPIVADLAAQGLDTSRVLVIHERPDKMPLELAVKALAAGTCAAVLVWLEAADPYQIGQLQLAAKRGNSTGFVFRPATVMAQPSPAELRVYATTHSCRLGVEILQCKGGPGTVLHLGQTAEKPLLRRRDQRLRHSRSLVGELLQ